MPSKVSSKVSMKVSMKVLLIEGFIEGFVAGFNEGFDSEGFIEGFDVTMKIFLNYTVRVGRGGGKLGQWQNGRKLGRIPIFPTGFEIANPIKKFGNANFCLNHSS